jgi:hypothetical protein
LENAHSAGYRTGGGGQSPASALGRFSAFIGRALSAVCGDLFFPFLYFFYFTKTTHS